MYQGGALLQAADTLRLIQQIFININRDSH